MSEHPDLQHRLDFGTLSESMDPELYRRLQRAIELGKWPDGQPLSKGQRALCLQAVIVYEHRNIAESQRSGHIPERRHSHCGGAGEVALAQPESSSAGERMRVEENPLRWSQNPRAGD